MNPPSPAAPSPTTAREVALLVFRHREGRRPEVLLARPRPDVRPLGGFARLPRTGAALDSQASIRDWLRRYAPSHRVPAPAWFLGAWPPSPFSAGTEPVDHYGIPWPPEEEGFGGALHWEEGSALLRQWSEGHSRLEGATVDLIRWVLDGALPQSLPRPGHRAESGPGILEIHPGVVAVPVHTPTLPPATHTNAYVLGRGDFLVVEPASPEPDEQERLWQYVCRRQKQGHGCQAIVLTHHHPDHVGGLTALQSRLGTPVWAHAETAARLDALTCQRHLNDGDRIELPDPGGVQPDQWTVYHTPGHAPGHLCLLDRRTGAMVVGDMVAGEGTILIHPDDGDMIQYLDSLRRLRSLGARTLLPAHGGPLCDPNEVLDHYVRHRLQREMKIVDALMALGGRASIDDLLPLAYDDTPPVAYPLAALAMESHLRKLAREGTVAEAGRAIYALRT